MAVPFWMLGVVLLFDVMLLFGVSFAGITNQESGFGTRRHSCTRATAKRCSLSRSGEPNECGEDGDAHGRCSVVDHGQLHWRSSFLGLGECKNRRFEQVGSNRFRAPASGPALDLVRACSTMPDR